MQSQASVIEPPGPSVTPATIPSASSKPTSISVAGNGSGSSSANLPTVNSGSNELNLDVCSVPGFQLMQIYFAKQPHITELYYLLFALLFDAQRIKELPVAATHNHLIDLNAVCKYVFDKSFDSSEQTLFSKINTDISLDVSIILFGMIRSLMNEENTNTQTDNNQDDKKSTKDYAIILLQIFRFMYHNCDDFRTITTHSDFLGALISTVFPYEELSQQQASTPLPLEIKPFAEAICDVQSKTVYKSYLSIHPARKLVMDFLKDLIFDGKIVFEYIYRLNIYDVKLYYIY